MRLHIIHRHPLSLHSYYVNLRTTAMCQVLCQDWKSQKWTGCHLYSPRHYLMGDPNIKIKPQQKISYVHRVEYNIAIKKGWTSDTCNNMEEFQKHDTKGKKADSKSCLKADPPYIIFQKSQDYINRQQISVCQGVGQRQKTD